MSEGMGGNDQHPQPTMVHKACLRPLVRHTGEADKGEAPINLENGKAIEAAWRRWSVSATFSYEATLELPNKKVRTMRRLKNPP